MLKSVRGVTASPPSSMPVTPKPCVDDLLALTSRQRQPWGLCNTHLVGHVLFESVHAQPCSPSAAMGYARAQSLPQDIACCFRHRCERILSYNGDSQWC
jgi:hypothetical protein